MRHILPVAYEQTRNVVYRTHVAKTLSPINIKPVLAVLYGPLIYVICTTLASDERSDAARAVLMLKVVHIRFGVRRDPDDSDCSSISFSKARPSRLHGAS